VVVNSENGRICIKRVVAVHDCGQLMNPRLPESQERSDLIGPNNGITRENAPPSSDISTIATQPQSPTGLFSISKNTEQY
jgi:hypothetical protein